MTDVDVDRVMKAAIAAANGDMAKAEHWYSTERISEFGGKTAEQLVAQGRATDVIRLIHMLESGFLG
jgi:hypothetical protein